MKKVLSVEQIREADAYTIKNEPIASIDLMERASMKCVKWLEAYQDRIYTFYIFCGPGNNGGDGLAIARLLAEKGFEVKVVIPQISKKYSADFSKNHDRLIQQKRCEIVNLKSLADFPEITENHIIIDAIFGSGLSKPVSGLAAELIIKINKSEGITIAIDMPSGMFADQSSIIEKASIIQADYTLSFQFPKLAFFMPENDIYAGKWEILSIGLSDKFIDDVQVKDYLIKKSDCRKIFKKRAKFSHKGNYGHALLVAGSLGKMGAAVLASKACLRSGVGLLTSHIPQVGNLILQTAVPEAMISLGRFENYFSDVPDLSSYSAIGVGPGIGMEEQTRNALKVLIQNANVPMVFDADALNILSENITWLAFLPKGCIITPHPKEFERLAGKSTNDFEQLELAKAFAVKYEVVVILKGAYTKIITPLGECFFNSTGNPGMATAGSGDVLTGIVLSLMAQGYSSVHAALIGVYVHGLAGDQAAKKMSEASIIASDIIGNLGKAFKKIEIKKVK